MGRRAFKALDDLTNSRVLKASWLSEKGCGWEVCGQRDTAARSAAASPRRASEQAARAALRHCEV